MNHILKRILLGTSALLLLLITIAAAVNAQDYDIRSDLTPINPTYFYYQGNERIPDVYGPFPRYYLAHDDFGASSGYLHDDFNYYDNFQDYRDLDVYYPSEGKTDVLRNPSAQINPGVPIVASENYTYFGDHVYGTIPGGGIYVKHYHHEHPWEGDDYSYGYSFTPIVAYRQKPVYTHPCQVQSICQKTHSCCN